MWFVLIRTSILRPFPIIATMGSLWHIQEELISKNWWGLQIIRGSGLTFHCKACIVSMGRIRQMELIWGDIFQSYLTIPHTYGNSIGQGIKHNLFYADAKAAYVLNPKYNLRFEVGYTQRFNRVEDAPTEKSGVITFGLRSSFRNFYGDM